MINFNIKDFQKNIHNLEYNPRYISKEDLKSLQDSMDDLGDIGGFIINYPSGELIGGNMRNSIIDLSKAEIEIIHQYDEPQENGDIAYGYAIYQGHRFNLRIVQWDDYKVKVANLRANKLGGKTDWDILLNNFDEKELLAGGFTEDDILGFDLNSFDDPADPNEKVGTEKEKQNKNLVTILCEDETQAEEVNDLIIELFQEQGLDLKVLIK